MKDISFRITSMLLTFTLLGVSETFAQIYERTFSFTFTKENIEISKGQQSPCHVSLYRDLSQWTAREWKGGSKGLES